MPKMINSLFWFDGTRAVRLDEVAYFEVSGGPNHLTNTLSMTLRSGFVHRFVADTAAVLRFREALRTHEDGPTVAAYRQGLADAL